MTRMPRLHPHDHSHQLDLLSAGLMFAAFLPLVLALQLDKTMYLWTSPLILGLLATSVVFLGIWIFHSLKLSKHPILNLRLFLNPIFTKANVANFFFGAAFLPLLIFLPLYMVKVQGVSAMEAGASLLPLTMGIVVGAGISGPIASKLGRYKALLVVGSGLCLVAGLLMTTLSAQTPLWLVIVFMVIAGIGLGPAQSLYSLAIQNAVTPPEMGQATSFSQFARQIGSVVGAAITGAIFSAAIHDAMMHYSGLGPVSEVFAEALDSVWWVMAILTGLLVLTTVLIPSLPLRGKGEPATTPLTES